ncbi:MAG: hypothetical protein ACK4V2_03565 [Pseudomonadota bacterium]|jgi:hypothetical protein|nr:hypothetical protein [Alphaproteobacteria bacterium]
MKKTLISLQILVLNLGLSYVFCSIEECSQAKECLAYTRYSSLGIPADMSAAEEARMLGVLKEIPTERFTPKFKKIVKRLSPGMRANTIACMIEALGLLSTDQDLQIVAGAARRLLKGMREDDKGFLFKTLVAKVQKKELPEFEAAVNRFSLNIRKKDRRHIFFRLRDVPTKRLTPEFEAAVNRFSLNMDGEDKGEIIDTLNKVPVENFTALMQHFTDSVLQIVLSRDTEKVTELIKRLAPMQPNQYQAEIDRAIRLQKVASRFLQGINEEDREYQSSAVDILRDISEVDLPEFEATFNRLSEDMSGADKIDVIIALDGTKQKLSEFEAAVNRLTLNMSPHNKCWMISGLSQVSEGHLISDFETALNRLSLNMDGADKCNVMFELNKVPSQNLITLMQHFTDPILQFVSNNNAVHCLIKRLAHLHPNQYQAEITRYQAEKALEYPATKRRRIL